MIDATNRNTALASVLVEELARCGVAHAVISPGSRSTPLALALDAREEIASTIVLDERAAAHFALGAAQATLTPTVVACTSGSAAANLHPAVVEADQAGLPLIVLTSDRPPELRGIGAGQTIDQIKLFGSAVRWFCEAGTHEADDDGLLHFRSIACRAFATAVRARGPVHVNLSWRDPLGPEPRPGDVTATSVLAVEGRPPGPLSGVEVAREPGTEVLERIAAALASAERPLIVAGRQPDPDLAGPVAALAAAAGAPILAEPTSQLRFGSHDRSRVIDAYDPIARAAPDGLAPDLVLRFGDMPTSKALRTWLGSLPGLRQFVIDPPGAWNEPTRTAELVVRVDPGSLATALAAQAAPADDAWATAWLRADQIARDAVEATLASASYPNEPAIHRELASVLDKGELLFVASSMPVRDLEAFAVGSAADVQVLCNRGANGIDGLIAAAAGAAMASERPCWMVLGDLALAHDLSSLALLAEVPGPFRIVVIDNGGGGIFEFLPQAGQIAADTFERLFITPSQLDLERVAGLFDLPYAEVTDTDGLERLAGQRRVLARVGTDRGANVELHARIAAAVAVTLS